MTGRPRVTIAGGGIAGLTAALRLAERGYQVKVYEQNSMLGGDLGSRTAPNGVHHDVYPHMYLNWYHNSVTAEEREGTEVLRCAGKRPLDRFAARRRRPRATSPPARARAGSHRRRRAAR